MHAALDLTPMRVLHLDIDQYLGLWAIDEAAGMQIYDRVLRMNLAAHCEEQIAAGRDVAAATIAPESRDELTISVIDIRGTMTKRGSSLSSAGSTVRLRREVRQAAADPNIDGIMLRIDSPGGTVAGTADLAAEVAAANKKKPVYAFAEDTTASAAYWVASQAAKVYANNRTAKIGSIGTLLVLYDFSGAAEKEGIRPVVVKTGELKGVGVPGAPVTADQETYLQQLVDETQTEFSAEVATGRNLSADKVAAVATGRVYSAVEAQSLGLIDGIASFDATLGLLASAIRAGRHSNRKGPNMSNESTAPQPATYPELKAAFPKAAADFLTAQLDAQTTLDQARAAWQRNLEERAEAAEARAQQAEAAAKQAAEETAAKKPIGSAGLNDAGTATEQDAGDFAALVDAKVAQGMPRHLAARKVAKENPAAREAYVAAYNAVHKLSQR